MYKVLICCFNPLSIHNIYLGFQEAGCTVRVCYLDQDYLGDCAKLKSHLFKAIDELRPDFVYSFGWWKVALNNVREFTDILKQKGLFHIYWAYDDPDCLQSISLPMALTSDLVFTTAAECIPVYQKSGIPAFLLPHGCCPSEHKKISPQKEYAHDITLLAHNYNVSYDPAYFSYRFHGITNIIRPLADHDFDLKIWGLWWTDPARMYQLPDKNYGGILPPGNEAKVHSSTKIALGLQTVGTSLTQTSVRTFEILGCGAFHLSQYSPALEHYFKKGIHMEWSKSPAETLELANFYLSHDRAREKVSSKGQQEVYEKHTLLHRVQSILDTVKEFL
ncbi:CgeB family protein [Candidatus Formimonas warabiya]|uniref:Glycosyltransferase n=1 Tax=Formimonas warabiya TaxID=1761012 RepID=A0A3G1KSH5_FORW1|nr:glycosyltransferase [Candidatus Formimonas warabiya]ATW25387.1 hypothetical protein DCMF_11945 [Candidatus Formimonas warabiya]